MAHTMPRPTPARSARTAGILAVATVGLVIGLSGCTATSAGGSPEPADPFTLTIPETDENGYLPDWALASVLGQCDGENTSPTLEWSGVPEGTVSLAVTMVNPEEMAYPHWVVTVIDPETSGLARSEMGRVEEGIVGRTFSGNGTYVGPCWQEATYTYTVYALDILIEGDETTTYAQLMARIDGHVLAEASADTFAPNVP